MYTHVDNSKIDLLHKNVVHWSMYTHVDNSKLILLLSRWVYLGEYPATKTTVIYFFS